MDRYFMSICEGGSIIRKPPESICDEGAIKTRSCQDLTPDP